MNAGAAVVGGLIGGGAMVAVLYPMIWMLPRQMKMDFLKIVGTMVVPAGASAYVAGLMIHGMMSAAFGLVHGGVLTGLDIESAGAGAGAGALIGFVHAAIAGTMLGVMPLMHPRMRPVHPKLVPAFAGGGSVSAEEELLDPPGFFGLNYPPLTVMGFFMLHVMFGLIVGVTYGALA